MRKLLNRIHDLHYTSILLLLLIGIASACSKDDSPTQPPEPPPVVNVKPEVQITYEAFEDYYLWIEDLPQLKDEDLAKYNSAEDLLPDLLFEKDKWSFVMDLDVLDALINSGESVGWGAGFKFDPEDKLRISYVYDDSPLGNQGVTRGWEIKSLNGQLVRNMSIDAINQALFQESSATFGFVKLDGTEEEAQLAKGAVKVNTVLHHEVFDVTGTSTGYLVFNEFLTPSKDELDVVFEEFKSSGVQDLILDLRYNGGGTLDAADHLAGLIAGIEHNAKVYNTMSFNSKRQSENSENIVELKDNSITTQRIVVLGTSSTASASELVIAGMQPYYNPVTLIGTASHGKPVGMEILASEKYNLAIAPISFRNINIDGYTDYFEGIPANYELLENAAYPFGSDKEVYLSAAKEYLETGSVTLPGVALKSGILKMPQEIYSGHDNRINELIIY